MANLISVSDLSGAEHKNGGGPGVAPLKMGILPSLPESQSNVILLNDPQIMTHPDHATDPETQRKLKAALDVEAFVNIITEANKSGCGGISGSLNLQESSSDDDSEILSMAEEEARQIPITARKQVSSFDKMKKCRRYLDLRSLLEDSDDDSDRDFENEEFEPLTEERFQELFRNHVRRKKVRAKLRKMPESLFNGRDMWGLDEDTNEENFASLNSFPVSLASSTSSTMMAAATASSSSRKRKKDKPLTVDQLKTRRKRLWVAIMKKEISKAQKARNYNQKEKIANSKRIATHCMRMVRQRAMQSQRAMKETVWRAKRLTREMQAYWKRFDRAEKIQKRQQEKEAEEQRKMDVELLEAKRQQRKLNFLITQTELYAHFMASKISKPENKTESDILKRLEEDVPTGRMAEIDNYDSERLKAIARKNAEEAISIQHAKTNVYDKGLNISSSVENNGDRQQPEMFVGTLKNYQLKGMNWLMNLYDQGINGILADEMGLGKTVQALAMLGYIAETYNIWGPFLVITPASTLHNWQQEVARFCPNFKVIPYWGSPQERKTLRHFWDQKNLHTRNASFHVVITSYQLVITDFKYFNRIKWQYLVLDEAQAIKSSSSQRWKMLLEFKCRNRLLLSGTPIQNSMAELWSLLHFVMPTLFDSHQEFNDWFSKDIESTAENKSQIDEKQISRLHLILKPFMLRRIKKDVENELTDKLEILVYCPLTIRQKLLYMGLKKKIRIEDLLQGLGSQQSSNSSLTSSLMNLVMQFRKVCNHPELFERREARSPFVMNTGPYYLTKLTYNDNLARDTKMNHLFYNKLCIFNPLRVHRSLHKNVHREKLEVCDSSFSYLRFVNMSPQEQFNSYYSVSARWVLISKEISNLHKKHHMHVWNPEQETLTLNWFNYSDVLSAPGVLSSPVLSEIVFTGHSRPVLGYTDVTLHSMPETMSHRLIRTRHLYQQQQENCDEEEKSVDDLQKQLVPEITHVPRPELILRCQLCTVPPFLYDMCPSVAIPARSIYVYDSTASYRQCGNVGGFVKDVLVKHGSEGLLELQGLKKHHFRAVEEGGLWAARPVHGWSNIVVPNKQTLVSDAGKLFVLDSLLARLKEEGHRVLIYSQMTRMIDLLEEYMWHRKHTFMRLDGSSKIHERRDMVADFQQRSDIFVFLLSTRAGGLGINLTAADTVIFYDSDWNPTVDQQAMDRAHRLGQTKQVTVYRLICKGTIEERILQRAREKSEIQRMVIQGGSFKGKHELKPKEVVSLLLDDEEIEKKYKLKAEEEKHNKKRTLSSVSPASSSPYGEKRTKLDDADSLNLNDESSISRIHSEEDDTSSNLMIDVTSATSSSREPTRPPSPLFDFLGEKLGPKRTKRGTGGRRGRPPARGGSVRIDVNEEEGRGAPSLSVATSKTGSDNGLSLTTIKRGPGRPRLKTGGPLNQGGRGIPKQAKPTKLKNKGLPATLAATLSVKYSSNPSSPSTPPKFYNENP